MTPEIERTQKLRDEVRAFIGSPLHKMFLTSTENDLSFVNEQLLDSPVEDLKAAFLLAELKGKRQVLLSNVTLFEDAVATLDNRIEELILGEEQPSATQQETHEE